MGSKTKLNIPLKKTRKNNKKELLIENILPNEKISPELMEDNISPLLNTENVTDLEDQILSKINYEEEEPLSSSFNSNIVDTVPENVREKIAAYLEEAIKKDKANRQPWLDIINKAKPYLGFNIENVSSSYLKSKKNNGSIGYSVQCETFDTTFSTSILRLWATLRSELLPATGPVGFSTDVSIDEDYELKGEMVKDTLNEYLTIEDKGFYPDYDRFLLYLILYGCVFRKIYYDPVTGKPLSRFIIPEDFLVDNNCSSIEESNRLTHIRYLSKREILFNIQNGIFAEMELDYLDKNVNLDKKDEDTKTSGIDQVEPTDSRFPFYETHEYLDLNEFFNDDLTTEDYAIPAPYVITRCGTTNQIVSIVPNWREDDPTKTRINCFIHYNLFPGFDVFGLGMAQILGNNAQSLTVMQQMAIDASIFQNCPAFMKAKGLKTNDNDLTVQPGQIITVTTSNLSLRDSIMPIPANGPSPAILDYMNRVTAQTQELASTTDGGLVENSQNTPVGTTIALLEVSHRMQSAIMKTIHNSFSEELQLFYKMFNSTNLNMDYLNIIPVSDPSVESSTQRIIKAESILKLASSNPELHNMREVYLKVYQALGVKDIDKILLPEVEPMQQQEQQPIDPALQVQMADIEQRRLEVESKERIAHLNIEADGYKTQMNIELDKAKQELEKYLTELKVQEQGEVMEAKNQIELLKLELSEQEKVMNTLVKEQEVKNKTEIELLKLEFKAKETELKAQIDALKAQNQSSIPQEEVIYG